MRMELFGFPRSLTLTKTVGADFEANYLNLEKLVRTQFVRGPSDDYPQ